MNILITYFKQRNGKPEPSFAMVKRMFSSEQPPKSRKRLFSAVRFNDFVTDNNATEL